MRRYCWTENNPEVFPYDQTSFPSWVRYAVYQLEQGETGTPHVQGYMELNKPQRMAALKKWLPRAHFEPARTDKEYNIAYCTKPGGRLDGPYTYGVLIEGKENGDLKSVLAEISKGKSVDDVISENPELYSKHRGVMKKARTAYFYQRFCDENKELELRPWQREVLELLKKDPDRRSVIWIHGSKGGEGKTTFMKYLVAAHGAFMANGGRNEDIAYAYDFQRIVCIDFPRASPLRYDLIEHLKDGVLFNQKYESHPMYFPAPHVVVSSNLMPDPERLSQDRVILINLNVE
jgi:hypothetical protein